MRRAPWVAAALVAILAAGCGYRLSGAGTNVPPEASTISIELFRNRSREKGLEVDLQRSIKEEFRRRGTLDVAPDGEGDLVLTGSIQRLWSNPVAFSATLEAVEFQSNLLISLKLSERATGKVLYQNPGLLETTDFGALTGTVVTASPRFQDDTVNARDLSTFTNVQIGESRRRTAVQDLVAQAARSVYLYSVEAF